MMRVSVCAGLVFAGLMLAAGCRNVVPDYDSAVIRRDAPARPGEAKPESRAVGPYVIDRAGEDHLQVTFHEPTRWNGKYVPGHQTCNRDGGSGSTPPLHIQNIPPQANAILLSVNDQSNIPLSFGGGHGIVGFYHDGEEEAFLLPVPGETATLPSYAFAVRLHGGNVARGTVYLPPCSGGRNHIYYADVMAVDMREKDGKPVYEILSKGQIGLGQY